MVVKAKQTNPVDGWTADVSSSGILKEFCIENRWTTNRKHVNQILPDKPIPLIDELPPSLQWFFEEKCIEKSVLLIYIFFVLKSKIRRSQTMLQQQKEMIGKLEKLIQDK